MVVFFQLFEEGIVVFLINSALGGLLFLAFRSYVRGRVEEWLFSAVSDYIREQLEITLKNPEETARLLSPLVKAVIAEALKDYQKSQGEGMVKIPFLGKVPPQLVQLFLERFLGGSSKSKNEGGNPFA